MQSYYEALVTSVRDYVLSSGFDGVLIGLSGGIDSALVLKIAVDALGKNAVNAIIMPSLYTPYESTNIAIELANNLQVMYEVISINDVLQSLKSLPGLCVIAESIAEQNMQSRIRGLILMSLSNINAKIVLATGNRSEILTGYSTLYGDTCGGYMPLKYVYKTEVYKLVSWCNKYSNLGLKSTTFFDGRISTGIIPDFIVNRPPSAELKFNQCDSDSLPVYPQLDDILKKMIDDELSISKIISQLHDTKIVNAVKSLVYKSSYKWNQLASGLNFKSYKDYGEIKKQLNKSTSSDRAMNP